MRRFAAAGYDALLLIATIMLAALPFVLLARGAPEHWAARLAFQCYLLVVCFVFLGWFWVHGGQTLGMRAWRLKVVTRENGPLTWRHAALRFAAGLVSWATLGAGYFWSWFDREGLTLHDRISGTRLVLLPKTAPGASAGAPQHNDGERKEQQNRH